MIKIAKFKTLINRFFPFPIGPFPKFMGVLQLYYLYEVFVTNDTGGFDFSLLGIFKVFWSLITVIVTFQILANVSSRRWMTLVLTSVGLIVYTIAASYTFGSNDSLNWNVIAENVDIAFSIESMDVIFHSLDLNGIQYGVIIFILFSVLEARNRTVSKAMSHSLTYSKKTVGVVCFIGLVLLPVETMDPLLSFVRSGYFYYRNKQGLNVNVPPNSYPMLRSFSSTVFDVPVNQPKHIFLIVVESLNADVIGKQSPSGADYTPFLNQLKFNSVVVDPFYGNSIQTAKGHFALFFSMIPSLKGKAFVKYSDVHIQSLGGILKQHGYESIAFSAYENPNFDNTSQFLLDHGYDAYETVDPYLLSEDHQFRLKWGVKDDVFFKRFFDYFDQRQLADTPAFFTLMTIANHFPFDSMAIKDRLIYPNPKTIQQHYANSIRLVDLGIETFYNELKKRQLFDDSLVIITADHAFPLGVHGNYHLEAGYHEDSFRIPFFMTWPKVLSPQIISRAGSQLDVNPTVLDLLSISLSQMTFQGQSIFNPNSHPIYLVQPYAKHFSVVRYPYKYRFSANTEQEYVYNLSVDPLEEQSILHELSSDITHQFREDLQYMYMSQFSLNNNQVFPNQVNGQK